MIFGKTKLEMKVGVFVFIGIIILAVFVLSLGGFKTWASGYEINFLFNFVNGVKIGAPVRFAGVDVGEVKRINFIIPNGEEANKVQITGYVKREVKIPADSTVWVNTLGLLGEKYVEVMPGKNYKQCLANGQALVGNDPIAMHEVAQLAKNVVDDLDASIVKIKNGEGTIGRLLVDDSIYKDIEAAINYKQGTIGRFIYDDAIYKQVEALIADIKKHPWKLFWKTKD